MIRILPRNIIRFLLLVAFQILVFNNIDFSRFVNPYIYILFILLLPFETPKWLLLISGFALGLSIDIFSQTIGMHAFSTVMAAYARPFVLNSLAPRDGYEAGTYPRVFYYGLGWFVKYTFIVVFIHHLFLFYIEVFRFTDFFATFLRVLVSSLFSSTFIVLSQFFVFRK